MVNKLHKSFSVLLVLLQLIAPLVHAHSEAKYAPAGIHLPGLEYVQADHQTSTIKANALLCVSEGVIVGIGSGLKQKAMPPFDLVSPYSETTIKYGIPIILAHPIPKPVIAKNKKFLFSPLVEPPARVEPGARPVR